MMTKIDSQTREALRSGNINELKKVLNTERESLRNFIEMCSETKFKETQGKCQILGELIKLLG